MAHPTAATTSAVAQDYLKLLWADEEAGGIGLSVNDLARASGVVASTASENVKRLADQGLLEHQPYQKVHLTEAGRHLALGMVRRHRLIETYLHDALGFTWDEVHEEAEILEHAISERLLDRLDAALGYPTRDPHGDPIPSADGTRGTLPVTIPLLDLAVGQRAKVARVSDRDPRVMRCLEEAGVLLDSEVEICAPLTGQTPDVDPPVRVRLVEETQEKERVLEVDWCRAVRVVPLHE